MKKSVLILLLISLLSFSVVLAGTCFQDPNYLTLVGGSTPNSIAGYGAIDLCGECKPCGAADNVCPEDFYSTVTSMRGSCRNWPDPDCTSTITGYVKSVENNPIKDAIVYQTTATGYQQIATTIDGGYFTAKVTAGITEFYASYEDFDTEIVKKEIIRGVEGQVNITMSPGACTADCTDIFGSVCKAECQGVNGCSFTDATSYQAIFTPANVALMCDNFAPGTRLPVNQTDNNITYSICCNNATTPQRAPFEIEKRPKFKPLKEGDNKCIKDLGTHVIKAKYRGQTVKIVTKSWRSSCNE